MADWHIVALWLMLLAAVGCGVWVYFHWGVEKRRQNGLTALSEAGIGI